MLPEPVPKAGILSANKYKLLPLTSTVRALKLVTPGTTELKVNTGVLVKLFSLICIEPLDKA